MTQIVHKIRLRGGEKKFKCKRCPRTKKNQEKMKIKKIIDPPPPNNVESFSKNFPNHFLFLRYWAIFVLKCPSIAQKVKVFQMQSSKKSKKIVFHIFIR